jgi:hypothetical protein
MRRIEFAGPAADKGATMTGKRAKEETSIKWVQEEARKLIEERSKRMAAFIVQELDYRIAQTGDRPIDTHSIENLVDRAFDHAELPLLPREAVAFEIWNALYMRGIEITHIDKTRYVPKLEGGPGPARLREAFRNWYGKA